MSDPCVVCEYYEFVGETKEKGDENARRIFVSACKKTQGHRAPLGPGCRANP